MGESGGNQDRPPWQTSHPRSIPTTFTTEALRANPALLKLDLYCRGMNIDESCHLAEDGGREILRTRAGLGSGLELILPDGMWTNVPVTEHFVERSPYLLVRPPEGGYRVTRDGEEIATVELSPRPTWYERKTSSGKPMTRIGTLQGTYLGVYQAKVCEYWTEKPEKVNCKFCSVGLNLGIDDADDKSLEEVLEVARAIHARFAPDYPVPNRGLPKWIVWLAGPFSGLQRRFVARNVDIPWRADNSKSKEALGLGYRPLKVSAQEMFAQMIEAGAFRKA